MIMYTYNLRVSVALSWWHRNATMKMLIENNCRHQNLKKCTLPRALFNRLGSQGIDYPDKIRAHQTTIASATDHSMTPNHLKRNNPNWTKTGLDLLWRLSGIFKTMDTMILLLELLTKIQVLFTFMLDLGEGSSRLLHRWFRNTWILIKIKCSRMFWFIDYSCKRIISTKIWILFERWSWFGQ